jgi:agmatinase
MSRTSSGRTALTRGGEPAHAGVGMTFAGRPLVLDPADLAGADVVVVGAPFDDGTSNRPGARYGPRAIRGADDGGRHGRPHMTRGIDPFEVLDVVDYGDSEVSPADLGRSHRALQDRLGEILSAGAMPLVLGGDHSLSLPTLRALAEHHGPSGFSVLHLDTHADTAAELYGVRISHGTPFRVAVEDGLVAGSHIVQVGLRGTWPGPADFAWMREQGFRWHTASEIVERGVGAVVRDAVAAVAAAAPRTYLTVDIDVLDPAFAPGTGTPEPGGLTTRELLWALGRIAESLDLCAADVVEVCPPADPAGITALAAERCAVEILAGVAARRLANPAAPPRPEAARPVRGGPR